MVLSSAGERTINVFISQSRSPVHGNPWASVFLWEASHPNRGRRGGKGKGFDSNAN